MTSGSGSTALSASFNVTDNTDSFFPLIANETKSFRANYTYGTGSGQFDQLYAEDHTIAASSSLTLELNGGPLVNVLKEACSFAKIRQLIVFLDKSIASQATSVEIGGAASTPWVGPFSSGTATIEVPRDSVAFSIGGPSSEWAVTSGQNLKIANNDAVNSAKVRIYIIGIKV